MFELIGELGYMEYILISTVFLIPTILFLWAIINCVKGTFEKNNKIVWVLIILFAPYIGPILYLVMGRKQRLT